MNEFDLNAVVATKLTLEGVSVVTQGAVIGAAVREGLRTLLRAADPQGYAQYKTLKYPGGKAAGSTPESQLAATRFLFDRTRDLLESHYVPSNALHGPKQPEEGEGWE